jgi:hypothetical protein
MDEQTAKEVQRLNRLEMAGERYLAAARWRGNTHLAVRAASLIMAVDEKWKPILEKYVFTYGG